MEAFFIIAAVIAFLFDLVKKARKASRAPMGVPPPPFPPAPSPVPQTLADAQRQERALGQRPANPQTFSRRTPPQFGQASGPAVPAPAVPREATSADFFRQEQALLAEEPSALGAALTSPAPSSTPLSRQAPPLFGNVDDLVRAVILQEVLGPPLSRRSSPPPLPPA